MQEAISLTRSRESTPKKKSKKCNEESENSDDFSKTICWMKNLVLNTQEDKEEVINAMECTSSFRLNWFKQKPSLNEIFLKFPKYKEMIFLVRIIFIFITFSQLIH